MLIQALIDAQKLPDRRATRRTGASKTRQPAKVHGPFHRKMTAYKPRCVTCATQGRETRIPSYRTLCYSCEINMILTRAVRDARRTAEGLAATSAAARRTAVTMPRQMGS